jgi:spore photoproduct lyase
MPQDDRRSDRSEMKFDLDHIYIEDACRDTPLARRILARADAIAPVTFIDDGRTVARPLAGVADSFAAGKRRLVIMRRRSPFMMACPAGSAKFACCGYLVLNLASNCPMDCSYCFLQEYVADNPGFQLYANYDDAFAEIDQLSASAPARHFRIGTGELADSLAMDSLTGMSIDLVNFFAARENLTLELKTKTDEIENLLAVDPRGRVMVSWTLSPHRVFEACEHRTAAPSARIDAARRVLDAGYRVAFHLDPIIAYADAERDYVELLDELFSTISPAQISFISMGGLRMTPALRAAARLRFPRDAMLLGEDLLAEDGRYRTFAPMRIRLYKILADKFKRAGAAVPSYLCMENSSVHERVFGAAPMHPSEAGERLATSTTGQRMVTR